mgnify:CR=1 FL=1
MVTDNFDYNDNNEKTEYFKKVLSENIKKYPEFQHFKKVLIKKMIYHIT